MGPFGALAIMVTILYGIWRFVNEHVVPLTKTYVENQNTSMKEILVEHAKTREVFSEAITCLVGRIDRVEISIESIQKDLTFIKDKNVEP